MISNPDHRPLILMSLTQCHRQYWRKNMRIGVLVNFKKETDINAELKKVFDLEMDCCQLCCWDSTLYTKENAEKIINAQRINGVKVTVLWAGWSGPCEWNFDYGPYTLGLVPDSYRGIRLNELKRASDFAQMLGIVDIATHVGFIPEYPNDPNFIGMCAALRNLAKYMKKKNQFFLFETGQETPVTLLRAIHTIGTDNLGINYDMANLMLYGKGNSADALDVFGKYVRNTHCKDGEYPTDGVKLGVEKKLGEGRANIPLIIEKLKALSYDGPLIIEREITGEEQIKDIIAARDLLRKLI